MTVITEILTLFYQQYSYFRQVYEQKIVTF